MHRPLRLLMRKDSIDNRSAPPLEFGYLLRTSRPGDEDAWRDLGDGQPILGMTASHFLHQVIRADDFDPGALFFVTVGSRAAGVAYGCRAAGRGGVVGSLRFLAVKKSHRRKGLGKFLVSQVLRYVRDAGCATCEARVSFSQLPAIGLLLELGFKPVLIRPADSDRWGRILRRLGRRGPLPRKQRSRMTPAKRRRKAG